MLTAVGLLRSEGPVVNASATSVPAGSVALVNGYPIASTLYARVLGGLAAERKTILVVEDEPTLRETLADALELVAELPSTPEPVAEAAHDTASELSQQIADAGRNPAEVDVVAHGVDPERYRPSGSNGAGGPSDSRPYILFVGALEPRKDVPSLVAAYGHVAREGLPHELVLAGPVSLTTPTVHELLRRGTPIAWVSSGFWFLGSTGGHGPRSAAIRTAQYAAAADDRRRLAFARGLPAITDRGGTTARARLKHVPDEAALRARVDAFDGDAEPPPPARDHVVEEGAVFY